MLSKIILSVLLLLVGTSLAGAETPQEKGLRIANAADDKDTGWQDSLADVTMILKTKQGDTSRRVMKVMAFERAKEGDKSFIEFETPNDVKGTVLVTHSHASEDDEQWLYLPALKRVKRVASANKSGPFVGSEYAYEDMIPQEISKYSYKYIKDEQFGGYDCYVVERYPLDKTSGYTRQVVWLDKAEYRILKIDYYDRKESLLKTLKATKWQQYLSKYWRPDVSEMVNHQTGKSTLLKSENFQFGKGLNEAKFNPNRIAKRR